MWSSELPLIAREGQDFTYVRDVMTTRINIFQSRPARQSSQKIFLATDAVRHPNGWTLLAQDKSANGAATLILIRFCSKRYAMTRS
jgi:hypothetical protein